MLMKKQLTRYCLGILVTCFCVTSSGLFGDDIKAADWRQQKVLVLARLKAAASEKDTNATRTILKDAEFLDDEISDGENDVSRKERLEFRLAILNYIFTGIDDSLDPKDQPTLNVSPPAGAGIAAGGNPSAIADPVLRKEYERRIADNQLKRKVYSSQIYFHGFKTDWTRETKRYVVADYKQSNADKEEVRRVIATIVSDSHYRGEL